MEIDGNKHHSSGGVDTEIARAGDISNQIVLNVAL